MHRAISPAGNTMTSPSPDAIGGSQPDRTDPDIAWSRDWAFLVGEWTITHRQRKAWLVGSDDWHTFEGTCINRSVMGGQGNIDDHTLYPPTGQYRAVAVRSYDLAAGRWAIWWIDSRFTGSVIDPPMRGLFEQGEGTFFGADAIGDRQVRTRFRWTDITDTSARWEQASSDDDGASWETNWIMEWHRK